jgi:hypothetical protein
MNIHFHKGWYKSTTLGKAIIISLFFGLSLESSRSEAMLQLFNVSWKEVSQKMPELAEAGYTSLWLPPPTKGSGGLSVGYDLWDPYDLGSKDQRGSISTRYGTEAELLKMIETAHRFGIRVYFDNIMNHRAFDVPGYNENTPIDIYPGLVPEDFHLRKTEDGFYRKWDNTRDWGSAWQVQNLGLADLIDIAHETPNANFGLTEGSTHPKISLVRSPNNPEHYDRLPDGTYVGFGPNNGITKEIIAANPEFYKEDVGGYLIRNVKWFMDRTKADGLRLDAVKHVPDYFFGQQSGANKDSSDLGYLGAVQRQFNITRGFNDTNHRDSVFDEDKVRNDAMVFGEHLGQPPGYSGYWDAGMRLVDNDLRSLLNNRLGNPNATLNGLDGPGAGGFSPDLGITHANSHDSDFAAQKTWQHAFYMTRDGMGLIYSDGYYQAETLGESGGAFPRHANTAFLGQFGDSRIPNILKIHKDFARGLQEGRRSDRDYVAFERRDNRNRSGGIRSGNAADEITMVVMLNDNIVNGQSRPISTSFPSGAYLYQYATGPDGSGQVGFYKWGNELGSVIVPPGGYYVFGYRTPELSNLWPEKSITLYQNNQEVSTIRVNRKDGPAGDKNFNPNGLNNRGFPTGTTPLDFTYQVEVPVIKGTNPVTILARADGSAENIMLKLNGGIDLNGTVPTGVVDGVTKRDNPPGWFTDTWLGYEQPLFVDRQHPEKFAAVNTVRNKFGSPGAETYVKTIGGAGSVNNAVGANNNFSTENGNVASFVYHNPEDTVGGNVGVSGVGDKQFSESSTNLNIWTKSNPVGAGFRFFVYYTTDGSFPEGAGGVGRKTTKVAELLYRHKEGTDDWWSTGPIENPAAGTPFIYKIGAYKAGASSWWPADEYSVNYKKNMLTTFRVNNLDLKNIVYHKHNDHNSLTTGLSEGFHILRSRAFLNRNPDTQAPLFQTFSQVFYYDSKTPEGEIVFPSNNGDEVGGSSYELVLRTDPSVEEVWFHIDDSDNGNNDSITRQVNGNGSGFEPFVDGNRDGIRQSTESFTDINDNGVYDSSLTDSWSKATEVVASPAITNPLTKEWRFRYVNIPASGTANIQVKLLEASSSRNLTLSDSVGWVKDLTRSVSTRGPLERVNIAWPQNDGDLVDDNYTMKVYFTKALSQGLTQSQLLNRFTFKANDKVYDKEGWVVNYGSFGPQGEYHELSIPLPNLYNDVPSFNHKLEIIYKFPDNRELVAQRNVLAKASSKPFIRITNPAIVDSAGRPIEIVLEDKPGPDSLTFPIKVETSLSVNSLTLTGIPAITILQETYTDSNSNGVWDAGEEFSDSNNNGVWDGITKSDSATTRTWTLSWYITESGSYALKATDGTIEALRVATVVSRQTIEPDSDPLNDDDHDGIPDNIESNLRALPVGNAETWTNGDVHLHKISAQSLPTSPDSDGDGLPDGLELGWRSASTPPTDTTKDFNGDGIPNFVGDLDPPLYAVVENHSFVPGVGSQSAGDDRTRLAYGSTTSPTNPDTDNDGIKDGVEDANKNGWTDGDGKALPLNATRSQYSTFRPNIGDWPNTKMDSWETWEETSPIIPDSDGDGLLDGFGEDINGNGFIDGDTNKNRIYDIGEAWTETNPLNADTDGDGLPDGWEVQYGLDPLDNGTDNLRTPTQNDGNIINGPMGDSDGDGVNNSQELANDTNPTLSNEIGGGEGEGGINIGSFTDWNYNDLLALDEYNEGGSQGADVYRTNIFDNSRDIVAFSFRDGGDTSSGGTGLLYFRIDFLDLGPNAWANEVDAYIVIDTGNPSVGERALPNQVDIATDMRYEAVVAAYGQNLGHLFIDKNSALNTTSQEQNPLTTGVQARGQGANGFSAIAWSNTYDAVEIAISRDALKEAGWLGDPNTLNFQVFTTMPNTQAGGSGDLSGRNDLRDTIYDDWVVSDYWKDFNNVSLNAKLSGYCGRNSNNDQNRYANVILLAHGNQAIERSQTIQDLVHNRANVNPTGYFKLLDAHENYKAPLTLHITPTLASALEWAKSTTAINDGPSFNTRIKNLVSQNLVEILGSTYSDHILKYFPLEFNIDNINLAEYTLDSIYGSGGGTPNPLPVASRSVFWTPERVLDDESLSLISSMGYSYTFADQMKHFSKWFGRSQALGEGGFRINQVNGIKLFPIHDFTSEYLDQTLEGGSSLPLRTLLSRRSRSSVQDQVVVLWKDLDDFTNYSKANSYDQNVKWLSSRPWIRIVTPEDIISGNVTYKGTDGNTYSNWGVVERGTGRNLTQTAKDWIDYATQENYDNWYFGSANEQGLRNRKFGTLTDFGQVGVDGIANSAWTGVKAVTDTNLSLLAGSVIHGAMFQTAFHNTPIVNLSKYSTGDYIYPDTGTGQALASFARFSQSQTRYARIYQRVQSWANTANDNTLGSETSDIDLDGANECLVFNSRLFAIFEPKGGRMTGAWLRNPVSGKVWQVLGNFSSYSGTDTEDEGASNLEAYRTSGFKDWWVIPTSGTSNNNQVNTNYSVTQAPSSSGTGWRFTSSSGGITKTITLANSKSTSLIANYQLSGIDKAYIRFGLSPNLLDLLVNGQKNLSNEVTTENSVELTNNNSEDIVKASVSATGIVNHNAKDIDPISATSIQRRNQAQTHQVEVELSGSGTIVLGFDNGVNEPNPDSDNDGLQDAWEMANFGNLNQNGNDDPDQDKVTNRFEEKLGSDPNNSSSGLPKVGMHRMFGEGYLLTFPTVSGLNYQIKAKDNLTDPNWVDASALIVGDGNHKTIMDTDAVGKNKRFYRLEVSIP